MELAVDPAGTVVRAVQAAAPPVPDPDDYTRANTDEGTFRPVVRAPASLPHELPASPLPRTTTIPVQSLATDTPSQSLTDVPSHALEPDFFAADARLEKEMDDARRETPVVVKLYPTVRIDSDISDVSASFKITNVQAVETETVLHKPVVVEEMLPKNKVKEESEKETEVASAPVETTPTVVIEEKSTKAEPEMSEKASTKSKLASNDLEIESSYKSKIDDIKPIRDKRESKRSSKGSYESKTLSKQELANQLKELLEIKPLSKKDSLNVKKELLDNKVIKHESKSATKEANSEFKSSTKELKAEVKSSTKELKSEFESSTKEVKSELKASTKELNSEPKTSSMELKSESKTTTREIKRDIKTLSKNEVPETTSKDAIAETKSSNKKELCDAKTLTKNIISGIKSSTIRESSETKISETKESLRETSYSKMSSKKDSSQPNPTTEKELVETKLATTDFPKLKTYSKEKQSDRDDSIKKELKESKSAWTKDSTKLDWSFKSESITTMMSSQKEMDIAKSLRLEEVQIKSEDQAWDMLLNEPEKQVLSVSPQSIASDKSDEVKTKTKKNRKIKKTQDDSQNKSEEDSFVEIHAIEDKAQPSSGELVSISLPFEEIESACSFSKTKKTRLPKNSIDKEQSQSKLDDWSLEAIDYNIQLKSSSRKKSVTADMEVMPEFDSKSVRVESSDTADIESIILNETFKDKKSKPVALSQENQKQVEKPQEIDVKDVYVIDSTEDEFPEIQITTSRASKMRKKSPQVDKVDKRNEEVEVIPEKPFKSWSSIAASKSSKKPNEEAQKLDRKSVHNMTDDKDGENDMETFSMIEKKDRRTRYQEEEEPLSLHEELMRLCKRTDIMVAQCDAPSGLNFVEEHHSLLQDLPPLELDFGLDDFRLEVMRDSLLDVNDTKLSSPICKIDIHSIMSSIKESTSAFNLIDLEKVPDKREKGFSVVENDKITSQEVKADDDSKSEDKEEVMEKSSDEDNASPALSTDSDKEDKKSTGASNITLPSLKQSSKSKKSRRKKK